MSYEIAITAKNFSLADTITCGQFFQYEQLGHEAFLVRSEGNCCKMRQEGSAVTLDCPEDMAEYWKRFLDIGTDTDYDKALHFCQIQSGILKQAADFCGGIHIIRQHPWDTLVCFLISQNNNIPRIKGIVEKLSAAHGGHLPAAEALAKLNEADLSYLHAGYRARYLIEAARWWIGKARQPTMTKTQLCEICGVGPKVADCVLLYGFHDLTAYPKDVWIKKVIAEYFPEGFPETKFSGIVQQYLFHYIRHISKQV